MAKLEIEKVVSLQNGTNLILVQHEKYQAEINVKNFEVVSVTLTNKQTGKKVVQDSRQSKRAIKTDKNGSFIKISTYASDYVKYYA